MLCLAQLKSIHEHLDLGHGLTIEAYARLIDTTRAILETHNTLLSNLEESRKTIRQMDKALSEMSERMLSGIATIYQYSSVKPKKLNYVGWVEERNPTFAGLCWVSLRSTQPTIILN
ncbi:hypothetical protein [Nostoc sp. MG11]|uniref:hypothetical protein n=1 Tax=Nostoc sp. MG11 TaxID=2721166 RepID=UPI001D010894|nr:hypothetical protein [Nostoc sp. MG11]